MRNLVDVITQLLEVIPTEEEDLISKLLDIRNSCYYAPPENFYLLWNLAGEALRHDFPPDESDWVFWHHQVITIWTGKVYSDRLA